jgi:hypothetical protein
LVAEKVETMVYHWVEWKEQMSENIAVAMTVDWMVELLVKQQAKLTVWKKADMKDY